MSFAGSISMRVAMACALGSVLVACEDPYPKGKKDAGTEKQGDAGPPGEQVQLGQVARAFTTFHADTGGWPYNNRVWWADNRDGFSTQVNGTAFTMQDVALFTLPPANNVGPGGCTAPNPATQCAVPQCTANQTTRGGQSPCWNGPYLTTGSSMGTVPWLDAWNNALMYSYLSPANGMGGGSQQAPNGLIFIWSKGPDGIDSFTCSDASCVFNISKFIQGLPSCVEGDVGYPSDDIIIEVSGSAT